jgi:flagellar hook protein FlgE
MPDYLQAAPATAVAATTMPVSSSAPAATTVTIPAADVSAATPLINTLTPNVAVNGANTTYSYNFGNLGTVDGTSTLTIGGVTVAIPAAPVGETVAALQGQITALGQPNVSATVNGNVLSITAPNAVATAMNAASTIVGDMTGTTNTFTFNTGGTVDPTTNLTISGQTATGVAATITAPTVTAGETITQYATALTNALAASNITNVTVTPNLATNQFLITGANVTTANSVVQSLAGTTTNYDFGSTATVDQGTNFTITGQTATGAAATITAPTIAGGESVANYAAALTNALSAANIVGVTVAHNGSQIAITGANMTTANNMTQDLSASTINYNFGSSGGTFTTVNPGTNLTISGLTTEGTSATTVAPTVTSGETVTQYAAALNSALLNAGVGGVTVTANNGMLSITGANLTTAGTVIQDPVASANATGTMTFDANGNLVSPATNVNGISFAGLADGAATMNMAWDILGASGSPTITQVDAQSSTSGTTQNGFGSGEYNGFSIGSDGTVTATFTNGQKLNVGQLALANVSNLEGLESLGNSDYATTQASGTAAIGTSGTNGLGTITGGAIEESNVNISAEFSDLIIAQRGFEANSKTITTFDTITQETINMIH